MLTNYTPTKPVPDECTERYADGWKYADWWLSKGGSPDADSPEGWHQERYEGWWDRLAMDKNDLTQAAIAAGQPSLCDGVAAAR